MTLTDALRVSSNLTVAFVGVGGKTAIMYTLARELARLRRRVVVTASTPIFPPIADDAPAVLIADTLDDILPELTRRTRPWTWCVVARRGPDGMPASPPHAWTAAIQALTEVDNVLVEADAAHGKVFKGPASDEPWVPPHARLIVSMTGVEAVGTPLTEDAVALPGVVAALTGAQPGAPLSAQAVAAMLVQRDGLPRGAHQLARVTPLITGVDNADALRAATALVAALRALGATRVVLARMVPTPQVVYAVIPKEEQDASILAPAPTIIPFDHAG